MQCLYMQEITEVFISSQKRTQYLTTVCFVGYFHKNFRMIWLEHFILVKTQPINKLVEYNTIPRGSKVKVLSANTPLCIN